MLQFQVSILLRLYLHPIEVKTYGGSRIFVGFYCPFWTPYPSRYALRSFLTVLVRDCPLRGV